MPESVFTPQGAGDIAQVCQTMILRMWSVPCIANAMESESLAVFTVESMGATYSVTVRKEA